MSDLNDRLQRDGQSWRISTTQEKDGLRLTSAAAPANRWRRWSPAAAAAAVVVLTIGGVIAVASLRGHHSDTSGRSAIAGGQPTARPSPDPLHPTTPGWAKHISVSATPVTMLSQEASGGLISMPWRLVGLSTDRREMQVLYLTGDGDCVLPAGFEVSADATAVELWALSRQQPGRTACADSAKYAVGVVTLEAPLASRALLHGPTSADWERVFPAG